MPHPRTLSLAPGLFACAVFASAALVFLVEPMVAQLLLPHLGGSPAVWNTSVAFFQIALLLGYAYAHALQRLRGVRRQMAVHIAVLVLAGLVLPLRIAATFGQSSTAHPILWLLGVLALSVGAPFAALSATAPLLQAWFGRLDWGLGGGRNPYVLYAASNLGSLLALLAYPFILQPLTGLGVQTAIWSGGYAVFALLICALVGIAWRLAGGSSPAVAEPATPAVAVTWRERLTWVLLAAAPSSLLLGVTTHITTDVASAPFLWVLPLALYLATFVIAFQERPLIPFHVTLTLQAAAAAACLLVIPVRTTAWLWLLGLHLGAFFLTALMCHQTLAQRRPPVARLTEFYLWLSLGGVVGGAFNAFLAPTLFNSVWEYPLVLTLTGLARPWGIGPMGHRVTALVGVGLGCALLVASPHIEVPRALQILLFSGVIVPAFLLRDRAPAHTLLLAALAAAASQAWNHYDVTESRRSFFGVVELGELDTSDLGKVRIMVHGTTLHGAQPLDPALSCTPTTYYAASGPIAQVFEDVQLRKPSASLGAVGLGTGTVATFVRPTDTMRFFEIDPLVLSIAGDSSRFTYLHGCAKGPVSVVLGDARLSLAREPDNRFDLLLVDAFSSDSVPVHLLTVEAVRGYLRVIRPDGVVILHLSNRNLELTAPAAAVVAAAGGAALTQTYRPPANAGTFSQSAAIVVIAARTPQALESFRRDPRWRAIDAHQVRPWTDDYSNVLAALIARIQQRR